MSHDRDLWQLLDAGDWACAHGDDEALARVSVAVAARVPPELATVACHIGGLASRNLQAASTAWGRLSDRLRELGAWLTTASSHTQ